MHALLLSTKSYAVLVSTKMISTINKHKTGYASNSNKNN